MRFLHSRANSMKCWKLSQSLCIKLWKLRTQLQNSLNKAKIKCQSHKLSFHRKNNIKLVWFLLGVHFGQLAKRKMSIYISQISFFQEGGRNAVQLERKLHFCMHRKNTLWKLIVQLIEMILLVYCYFFLFVLFFICLYVKHIVLVRSYSRF